MILIAGGTGTLGTQVVRLLAGRGLRVRVLTRDPDRARALEGDLIEVERGDVRDRGAVERATQGAQTIISAVHGLTGRGEDNPRTVDGQGNSNLIAASRAAGVEHFILVSVQGAAPDHPMELARMKYRAEQELKGSGLAWTIIRPSAFMETWSRVIGEPLLTSGKTRTFGRGTNPINFVSARDVARFIDRAVADSTMRGVALGVGGPENLGLRRFVETFQTVTGTAGAVNAIPLPLMRALALLLRPINPTMARQIQAGVVMETRDMTFDPADLERRYPSILLTRLAEVVRRDYVSSPRTRAG
ncbi:MAG: SDR family oxidoreductase [Chloroflexi bacterium]|nr:SDR family oxidoreductase [Chloroflexota bacterium]